MREQVITLQQVRTLVFGAGCATQCGEYLAGKGAKAVFIVTAPPIAKLCEPLRAELEKLGCAVTIWSDVQQEPTIGDFNRTLAAAKEVGADAVVGLGGGSAMDVAKLVAAFVRPAGARGLVDAQRQERRHAGETVKGQGLAGARELVEGQRLADARELAKAERVADAGEFAKLEGLADARELVEARGLLEPQKLADAFGIGKLWGRGVPLVCMPTTSGTGSEVSPIAILLDEADELKKGVISEHLVPDAAFVDPVLTVSCPPGVTAATGLDALTHCIEAYANRGAHPVVDTWALEGIRLIGRNLARAVGDGNDVEARTCLARASLYGGLCLGPVNTAAVHALSYPLGGEFHVAHGVSNAVLLPHVLEFNLPAAPGRYADIAVALGVERTGDALETARLGVERLVELARECGVPMHMAELGVPASAIERMVRGAMTVKRLLDKNVRVVTEEDAREIYRRAM